MTVTLEQTIMALGAIGVPIETTIIDPATGGAADISTATTTDYHYRKPDGATTGTWSASFVTDGTDGLITYSTISGDIDQAGTWVIESRIVTPSQDYITVTQPQFRVRGTIL